MTTTKKNTGIIAIALITLTLITKLLFLDTYNIPSSSMEPTLHGDTKTGDITLGNKTAYWGSNTPQKGDIIVFTAPTETTWETNYKNSNIVKRIIATEGDTLSINDEGQLTLNGEPLQEGYISNDYPFIKGTLDCNTEQKSPRCFPTITIPEGQVLVLGDNRGASMDSLYGCRGETTDPTQCQGAIPITSIKAKLIYRLYPFGSIK